MLLPLLLATSLYALLTVAQTPKRTITKTDGLHFNIDGETAYFPGTNAYWLPFLKNNSDVDLVLDHMAQAGLRIVRTWGFNDVKTAPTDGTVWFQSFPSSGDPVINTGPTGLQRLDYIIRAAETRGLKLIIPFVNNWADYGGMEAYYAYCIDNNSKVDKKEQWYRSAKCQAQYQKYARTIIERHKESTAVLAWELANEPRCKGCDTKVVTEWARETSKWIKSVDSKHLVAVGDEGFGVKVDGKAGDYSYSHGEGTDFASLVALPDIDMGTFHLYPDHWNVTVAWGNSWIQHHAAVCVANNKPCLFEEYGVMASEKCSQETGWQATALKTRGIAGDQYWQYGDTVSTGKTADDKFTVYKDTANWNCMVEAHGKNIKASKTAKEI
ncbi:putative mannan endo-1,4-beta-mannosidase A [Microthyrium microscopicum]|uniref:mannan endo-1,4-beta-mannosidase n=1 Tax=Microthyrium microscopicum TaxID=703497 RepID=A0A6A6U7B0_9PEZI|nr:putative mannan endo-1,4-beta-mannosidase A [Microthyrium microscopicum]